MLAQSIWLKNLNVEQQEKHIEKYPDWRFTQIIFNVGLAEDRFYEESVDTFEKLTNFQI